MATRAALVLVDGSVKQLPPGDTLAGALSNPMTGVGDLIVGGIGGAPTRVPAPANFWSDLSSTSDGVEWRDYLRLDSMLVATGGSGTGAGNSPWNGAGIPSDMSGPPGDSFTGTTTTGLAWMIYGGSQGGSSMTSGRGANSPAGFTEARFSQRIRLPVLSDGTDTFSVLVGFFTGVTTTPGDGVYFKIDGSTLTAICRNSGSETSITWGGSVTTSSFDIAIRWRRAAGAVDFYVNGASIGTITTNLPTANFKAAHLLIKSAGTTSRTYQYAPPDIRYYRS